MRKHQLWVDAGRHERQLMGTSGLSYRRIKSAVRRQTANSLKPTCFAGGPRSNDHGPRLPMFQRVFLWHCRLTAASSRIPSRDLPAENSNTPAPSQPSTARRP